MGNKLVVGVNDLATKYPEIALEDLAIIHYAGPKPWQEHTSFQQDFEDVLKTSIFYRTVVKKWRKNKTPKSRLFGFIPFLNK